MRSSVRTISHFDPRRSACPDELQSGFSLVEMLVVLAVLALCMGVAGPSLRDRSGARVLDATVHQISALLRAARSEAILSSADASVGLDLEARRMNASWTAHDISIPETVQIEVLTAREELTTATTPTFRFFPDGSATGGTIRLSTPATARAISIDWLTGRITRGGPQ